ncbi:MAG: CPBP family intramembrane metalloprotease [Cellulosilyticum sp.]|nr:CPBP family intramembrane metalloprotease [Cellulosilyticum sp.]
MKECHTTKTLILYSLIIPMIMSLLFIFFSNTYGKTVGYFLPYGIYLSILLIGVLLFNKRNDGTKQTKSSNKLVYYIVSFIPVIATFFVAFLPSLPNINLNLLLVLLTFAFLNGVLEELFWRRTYSKMFGNNMLYSYIIPTVIFSCWHFTLLFVKGVTYHGGALALVGGATVMGAIWGWVMFKTKNVKVVISAHVITNFFAFTQLLCENWFIQ